MRAAFLLLLFCSGCVYKVNPDQGLFSCTTSNDCGSGWHCNSSCAVPGFDPYCVQDGFCDPCPDTKSDPSNCGSCGIVCMPGESCINSACVQVGVPDAG